MFFESFTLANKLRVIFLPSEGTSTTILGLVKTGSRYEDLKQEGLAHFYEHMVFKGTEKYPSQKDLALAVDEIGAEYNGATGQEYTYYYAKTAQKDFEVGLDLVSQLLVVPLLEQKEIDIERGVIKEELHMYYDIPHYRAQIELARLLFPRHPLGTSGVGNERTIDSFRQNDFIAFKNNFYRPERMVVVVVGEMANFKEIKKKIISRFSFLEIGGIKTSFKPFNEKQDSRARQVKKVSKKTDQVQLALGVRALSWQNEKRFAQILLDIILGGGMSSRLFQEIREKRGLCYSINSSVETFSETGVFEITAGLNNERLEEAVKEIKHQLFLLTEKEVSSSELEKAKHSFEGRLMLLLEDSYHKAFFFGKQLILEDSVNDISWLLSRVKSVSKSDILSVSREIFSPDKIRISLVGNFKGGEINC